MKALMLPGLVLLLRLGVACIVRPLLPSSLRSVCTLVRVLRLDIAGVSLFDLLM